MSKPSSGLFNKTQEISELNNSNKRIIPGISGVVSGGNSGILGKNLLAEMGIIDGKKWTGYEAQHIIPSEMKKHPVLIKIGMNLDDPSNGIFLRIPGKNVSVKSRHRGYHSIYSEVVKKELDKIDISQDSLSIQKQVRNLQIKLKKLQESGLPIYKKDGATVNLWMRKLKKIK